MLCTCDVRRSAGFSLIELMVSVAVVATLASIALPHYRSSVYRAQRVEAVLNLSSINTAQLSYLSYNDTFAPSFEQLDFSNYGVLIAPNVIRGKRYTYTLSRPWGATSYLCQASAELDGDAWPDVLIAYEHPRTIH